MESTIKKRKMRSSPQGTKADAGVQEEKEEDIVDETEPSASSNLSEEEKTAMSRIVKAMDLLSSIYDVAFRNLMKELELAVNEKSNGKVDFVPADLQYNIQRDRNDSHAVLDVFSPNDITDTAKVLGDVIKMEAQGHVVQRTIQIALWYTAHGLK